MNDTPQEAKKKDTWVSNFLTILGAVALALVIRVTLYEAFAIDGPSMEPTLQHGDRVVVAKYPFGLFLPWTHKAILNWGSPEVGDVVIVHSPMDNEDIVKRVIGVGGDTIAIRDGLVIRNGNVLPKRKVGSCANELQKEVDPNCEIYEESSTGKRYRISHSEYEAPTDRTPLTIPNGYIYVLGDHRDRSNDSRNPLVGTIDVRRVKGKALRVYMSWNPQKTGLKERVRWDRVGQAIE